MQTNFCANSIINIKSEANVSEIILNSQFWGNRFFGWRRHIKNNGGIRPNYSNVSTENGRSFDEVSFALLPRFSGA